MPTFGVIGGRAFEEAGADLCNPVYTKAHPDEELHMDNNSCNVKKGPLRDFTRSIYSSISTKSEKTHLSDKEFQSWLSLTMGKNSKKDHQNGTMQVEV